MCRVSAQVGQNHELCFNENPVSRKLMIGIQWRDFDGMSPSSITIPRMLATVSDTWKVLLHMQHAHTH